MMYVGFASKTSHLRAFARRSSACVCQDETAKAERAIGEFSEAERKALHDPKARVMSIVSENQTGQEVHNPARHSAVQVHPLTLCVTSGSDWKMWSLSAVSVAASESEPTLWGV
jgi:hypothetical protein